MKKITVGLFYNLRDDFERKDGEPVDILADFDIPTTINLIKSGLQGSCISVADLHDPILLLDKKIQDQIDIVFSICEMKGYRFRESIVPSLCELIKKPYVFSPPDTLLLSLDKNLCNFVVRQSGCQVPEWVTITDVRQLDAYQLPSKPWIVKPSAEGSGMGLSDDSVMFQFDDLTQKIQYLVNLYQQPVIVQEYLPGREFTVGVVESKGTLIPTKAIEVIPVNKSSRFIYHYEAKEKADRLVRFIPLENEPQLENEIIKIAKKSFRSIRCRDIARVDIRLDRNDNPHFLEINPLPHLHPEIGDVCRSAKASGFEYRTLLNTILENAIDRYGMGGQQF